jgi:predicted nucleotidyltransferase
VRLQIEDRHLKIILDILSKYPYEFFAFGSRVKGVSDKFSDLDLCFFENIPSKFLFQIEEFLEESDLPYKVDMVDFNKCKKDFQDEIMKAVICIQSKNIGNECKIK